MDPILRPPKGWANRGFPVGPLVRKRSAARVYECFTLTPATSLIGAYISGIRLNGELDGRTLTELFYALLEWKVLFFRDQDISRAEHRAFARLWGELAPPPLKEAPTDEHELDVASAITDRAQPGNNNNWHNDVTFRTKPPFAVVLRALELPETGGDTLWADAVAAYESLPVPLRSMVDNLSAEHDWIEALWYLLPAEQVTALRDPFPPVHHPVVRVIKETQLRALFVNPVFTQRIVGLNESESAEILSILYRHISRPEFQVRLQWQQNTIAMWDNRTCQHYAINDYYPKRRVMDRVAIAGDQPVGSATNG